MRIAVSFLLVAAVVSAVCALDEDSQLSPEQQALISIAEDAKDCTAPSLDDCEDGVPCRSATENCHFSVVTSEGSVVKLSLTNNSFYRIPKDISLLTNLELLDLSFDGVYNENGVLSYLTKIKSLFVHRGRFRKK